MKKTILFLTILFLTLLFNDVNAQMVLARRYAYEVAEGLMKAISPNTGKDAMVEIVELEFDEKNDKYIIDLSASWMAGKHYFAYQEIFKVRGILIINKDGTNPSFKETYRNEAVKGAWTNQGVFLAVGAGVAAVIAADAYMDSKEKPKN